MGFSGLIYTGSATPDDGASEASVLMMGASGLIRDGGAVAQSLITVCRRRSH